MFYCQESFHHKILFYQVVCFLPENRNVGVGDSEQCRTLILGDSGVPLLYKITKGTTQSLTCFALSCLQLHLMIGVHLYNSRSTRNSVQNHCPANIKEKVKVGVFQIHRMKNILISYICVSLYINLGHGVKVLDFIVISCVQVTGILTQIITE